MTARHGDAAGVNLDAWRGDDPELALVEADQEAWRLAHPCECEALCECEPAEPDALT